MDRRPLKTRQAAWAVRLAQALARHGVTPNQISLAGIGFAALAWLLLRLLGLGLNALPPYLVFLGAAACIQLRLLCNMLDGMVAVEGGRRTACGDLFNEFPDRVADVLIIVGFGHASGEGVPGLCLGWLAAVLAVITAYVRALGASLGCPHYFLGPMAKPHRMALLTAGCLLAVPISFTDYLHHFTTAILAILIVGTVITLFRRLNRIAHDLQSRR